MRVIQGSGGGGDSSAHTPVEARDSAHSTALAQIIDILGEGPFRGFAHPDNILKDVILDGTPVANDDGSLNFTNVKIDSRSGTQDQAYMQGFPDVENEIAVGLELTDVVPWTQTISDIALSGVRIRLAVPSLQKSMPNGDIVGYSISYAIDLKTDGGSFINVLNSAITDKCSGKFEKSHRIDLPPATSNWVVRVRRLTVNQHVATISDTMSVESYTELLDAKFRYPNTAYVGIIIDSKQFSSIPTRAYNCYGRIMQIPSNYDSTTRVYTGVWDGTFKPDWTNNPAWIFYDMCTNDRFGLGSYIDPTLVNKWNLYSIAQYCDGMVPDGFGGTEPRFSCTVYFQTQADAIKVIQDMSSIFRGMAYWAEGSIQTVANMPRDPVYTYSNSNVINGEFTYQGSKGTTRYTVALASWNNPANNGKAEVHYEPDPEGIARYGIRSIAITAIGATTRGQAQRMAIWTLLTSRLETEGCTWEVGADGTVAAPGQTVRVLDAKRAGSRQSGRIRDASTHTNLVLYSEALTNSAWVNSASGTGTAPVVTPNYAAAPDGTTTATRVQMNMGVGTTSNNWSSLYQETTAVSGNEIGSLQVKSNTGSNVKVYLFTLNAVVLATITPEWQAVSALQTDPAQQDDGPTDTSVDILVWHPQLENNPYIGGYNATTNAPVSEFQVLLDGAPSVAVGDSLTVTLPSGITQTKPVSSTQGSIAKQIVGVSAPFSETPNRESIWAIETAALNAPQFNILSVKENKSDTSLTYTLTGVAHNPSKFDAVDLGKPISTPPISIIPSSSQVAPATVVVSSVEIAGQILASVLLNIQWAATPDAIVYLVQYQKDNAEWISLPQASGLSLDVPNALPGVYLARVWAVNAKGVSSSATLSAAFTVNDQTKLPTTISAIQTQANNAAADAAAANQELGNIASDNILSQGEKPVVIRDWSVISAEEGGINAQADAFGVTTEKTAYDSAVTTLLNYLATLTTPVMWNDLSGDTTIVGTTFRTNFANVYTTRQTLLNAIYASAKAKADAAQSAATNVGTTLAVINPQFRDSVNTGWTYQFPTGFYTEAAANSPDSACATYLVRAGQPGTPTTLASNAGYIAVSVGQTVTAACCIKALGPPNAGAYAATRITWLDTNHASISYTDATVTCGPGGTFNQCVSRAVGQAPANAQFARFDIAFYSHTGGYFSVTSCNMGLQPANQSEVPNGGGHNSVTAIDSNGMALIDFTQPGHASKNVDNMGDGVTYKRVRGAALQNGTVAPQPPGKNMIGNSSFTANTMGVAVGTQFTQGGPIVDGWKVHTFDAQMSAYWEAGGAGKGPHPYMSMRNGTPLTNGNHSLNWMRSTPEFACVGGQKFYVSANFDSAWNISPPSGVTRNLRVGVQWYKHDGTPSSVSIESYTEVPSNGTLQTVYTTVTAPSDAAYGYMYLGQTVYNNSGATYTVVSLPFDTRCYYAAVTSINDLGAEVSGTLSTQRTLPNVTFGNYGSGWNGLSFSYTSTTTSATISASAATLQAGDDSISYNASSASVSGTAGTTATYYLYYEDPGLTGGSKTLQATTNSLTPTSGNNRVRLGSLSVTFPASGTGGGGGIGPCVTVTTYVHIKRGDVARWGLAGEVVVGDWLEIMDPVTRKKRWGKVTYSEMKPAECVRIETRRGIVLECSTAAPIGTIDGCMLAPELKGHSVPAMDMGEDVTDIVGNVASIGIQFVQHITCEDDFFLAGEVPQRCLAHHNLKP